MYLSSMVLTDRGRSFPLAEELPRQCEEVKMGKEFTNMPCPTYPTFYCFVTVDQVHHRIHTGELRLKNNVYISSSH